MKLTSKFFVLILLHSFLFTQAGIAASATSLLHDELNAESKGAEYVMRRYPGEKLMPIRILGGVQKPGIYYLPEGTDMLTAISLSGGLVPNADNEKIHINKWSTQQYKTIQLENAMRKPAEHNLALGANDVLVVDEKPQWVSNNTLMVLTAISSVVAITTGVIFISRGK